jgi:hypothetical protein
MTVGPEVITGVVPFACRMAVTTQVPALFALRESPLIVQPFAVPSFTRKLSAPTTKRISGSGCLARHVA